uniref:Uncharacterized protein n=1 Tax=Populus trichocarpa TaxID=3694 RepID=A0A2K2CCZ9_POPTR
MENVCEEEDEGDNENKLKAILFYQFEDIPKQVSKVFGGQNGALDDGIPCHAHTCPFYQGLYGESEEDSLYHSLRCSTPTAEKIFKLNQKYQQGNLRIHDQNRTSRFGFV